MEIPGKNALFKNSSSSSRPCRNQQAKLPPPAANRHQLAIANSDAETGTFEWPRFLIAAHPFAGTQTSVARAEVK
jgi:hypothetical protein